MTDLFIPEGNDKTWNISIAVSGTGSPIDITGDTFLFTVKNNINDSDDAAIIAKDLTTHILAISGQTSIPVVRDDTLSFVGNKFYDYQRCISGSDLRQTILRGNFIIKQSVGDRNC